VTETSHIRTGLRVVFATAVLAAAFVLPAQAFAGDNCSNVKSDPTQAQYCSPSNVQTGGNSGTGAFVSTPSASGTEAAPTSGSSLPFTGLDLAALLAVAAVLTATGLALRRLSASGGQ
jgi:hypothetical protein